MTFGALIFGTVSRNILYDVDTDWFKVFLGAMMLIAVIFNNYIRRKVMKASNVDYLVQFNNISKFFEKL